MSASEDPKRRAHTTLRTSKNRHTVGPFGRGERGTGGSKEGRCIFSRSRGRVRLCFEKEKKNDRAFFRLCVSENANFFRSSVRFSRSRSIFIRLKGPLRTAIRRRYRVLFIFVLSDVVHRFALQRRRNIAHRRRT